jgi:hypothetical protein
MFWAMEFYYMGKTLVAITLENQGKNESKTMSRLRIMKPKFTTLCRVAFGLSFKVTNWEPDKGEGTMEVT